MGYKRTFFIILIVLFAYLGYQYIYQDHRDIGNEVAEYTLTSTELNDAFLTNPEHAEQQYLNKTIKVSGNVSEVTLHSITLNEMVFCKFLNTSSNTIKPNARITIKGRVIGYDDLLEQVKLDQCIYN